MSVLGVYALGALAVLALRRKNVRTDRPPLLVPGGPLVPVITVALIGWIALQTATRKEAIAFASVWVLSLLIHVGRKVCAARQSDGGTT
jgi:amino acid transporter